MKRILAMLLLCALTLSFSACTRTELPAPEKTLLNSEGGFTAPETQSAPTVSSNGEQTSAEKSSETSAEKLPETSAEKSSETGSDQIVASEFIDDTHDWADGNRLYNIDGTYNNFERYNSEFAAVSEAAELWHGSKAAAPLNEKYDPEAAAKFSKEHWNDGLDVCAPFISRCLKAGGLSIGSESSTMLCLKLLNSKLGFGQFVPVNADRTVTLPDYAAPGDVVQVFCPYEGLMNHSLMFVGNDDNGHMKVCCHNLKNSGTYAFKVDRKCYDCNTPITEVFFYHFHRDNDVGLPKISDDVLLYESSGYAIPNQRYDRKKAAATVISDPIDGIGQFGAERTSAALSAGGISVGYPVQTALFMQLMKSRHGAMYSVPINPDRTVTLPEFAEEGDVCFLFCPKEAMFYSSFIIKGANADGKMLGYSRDKINNENRAFKVESVCPSSLCDADIVEVVIYHFDD